MRLLIGFFSVQERLMETGAKRLKKCTKVGMCCSVHVDRIQVNLRKDSIIL